MHLGRNLHIISEKLFFFNKEKDRKHGRGWGTEGLKKGIWKGRRERNEVVTGALLDKGILLSPSQRAP